MLKPVTLKNGITVLRLPKNNSRVFTVGFVAATGTASEKGNFPLGISYLIEKMFWCGTDKHPSKRSLNTALESIGGSYYSQTGQEFTEFYITVPSQHQFKAISMLAEVIQHSYFDARDLKTERVAVIEKANEYENSFESQRSHLGLSNLFHGHNLGTPFYGDVETLMSITQEDILDYLSRQYQPTKSYLVIAGGFETKSATDLLEQEWGYWNPKPKEFVEIPDFTAEDAGDFPKILYKQRGIPETHIVTGFWLQRGMQPREFLDLDEEEQKDLDVEELQENLLKEWAVLLVLNAILGQGFSSKLWAKGVEEEMLFEQVHSNIVRFSKTGYLEVIGITENSQFTFALESILFVFDSLRKVTVSMNEMTKAKEYLKGRVIMEQEDLLSSTIWQVENLIGSGLTFEIDDLLGKINEVQAAEVRELASNLFKLDNFFLTSLGTSKETRLVDKLLIKYLS